MEARRAQRRLERNWKDRDSENECRAVLMVHLSLVKVVNLFQCDTTGTLLIL